MIFALSFKLELKAPKIIKTYQCFSVALDEVDSRYKWREKSRDSAINIATTLGAGRSGVLIPVGATDFLQDVETCHRPTQPLIQWVRGSALSNDTKRPGRENGHSPPSSFDVKNEWIYTSISHICLHGVYKEIFTLVRKEFQRYHIWLVVCRRLWRFQMSPSLKTRSNTTVFLSILMFSTIIITGTFNMLMYPLSNPSPKCWNLPESVY
jgi:hypothetical protein